MDKEKNKSHEDQKQNQSGKPGSTGNMQNTQGGSQNKSSDMRNADHSTNKGSGKQDEKKK